MSGSNECTPSMSALTMLEPFRGLTSLDKSTDKMFKLELPLGPYSLDDVRVEINHTTGSVRITRKQRFCSSDIFTTLSPEVDVDKVSAKYEDGKIIISAPKMLQREKRESTDINIVHKF